MCIFAGETVWVCAYTNICIWTHVHEQVSEYRERLQAAKDNVMLVRDGMSAKITAANRRARASEGTREGGLLRGCASSCCKRKRRRSENLLSGGGC